MSIVDDARSKSIVVQLEHHNVFIHDNFTIERDQPFHGFVRIKDEVDNKIYWFNINAINWIGPRQ